MNSLLQYGIYAKSPEFGGYHPHLCTFIRIEHFHPLSPAFCLNNPQSPRILFEERKLPGQIFSQEEKRKVGHRSI